MKSEALFLVENSSVPSPLIGFNKIASMFELCHMGLPILDTIVATRWNACDAEEALEYIGRQRWPRVMIRSDQNPETPNSPRGGYLYELDVVSKVVTDLLSIGRVAILIEPANKYDNLYGINLLFDSDAPHVLLEIVGPGFDATDINRGDISPHELIWLDIKNDIVSAHIGRRTVTTEENYRATVQHRLSKIGAEVKSQNGISNFAPFESLEEIGWHYLLATGCRLLNRFEYRPLPSRYLTKLLSHIKDLPWRLRAASADSRWVVSLSALNSERPRFVFWDIVRPSNKYGLNYF